MQFNIFKKMFSKKTNLENKKSYYQGMPLSYTYSLNPSVLSIRLSCLYYESISIVSNAIDILADEFEILKPYLYNKKTKEFETDAPILSLLQHPNSDKSQLEFLGAYIRYYLITGNSFLIATGEINRPPLELYVINPINITIIGATTDDYPDYYLYQTNNGVVRFNRFEDKNGMRFINKDLGCELWHVRDFNSRNSQVGLWGASRLNAIYLEINQYAQSNIHNYSLLLKGVRASGILSTEGDITQDQQDKIGQLLKGDYQGSSNAGNVLFLSGAKYDFKELSQSLKDMDFRNLKKDLAVDIYNKFRIPLPLITTDTQTFNNYSEARLALLDNCVIPLKDKLYSELALFLFPRYNIDNQDFKFDFNIIDVEVLRQRTLNNAERLRNMNVLTVNELRNSLGYADIEKGDVIYQPLDLIPLGTDTQQQPIDSKLVKYETVIKELSKIKYVNGGNVFKRED